MTWSDHVPNPRRCGTLPRVFSTHGDEPGGAGRPVTAAARVPPLAGFLQQRCTVAPIGRPVTAVDLPPFPPAFAPGVCADARAHLLERLSGPPLAAASLVWRAVAVGTSCCTFVGSSRRTVLVRTRRGTRNSADVRSWRAYPSSTDAGTLPNVAASLATDYVEVDLLLTAARWISDWPPPKLKHDARVEFSDGLHMKVYWCGCIITPQMRPAVPSARVVSRRQGSTFPLGS